MVGITLDEASAEGRVLRHGAYHGARTVQLSHLAAVASSEESTDWPVIMLTPRMELMSPTISPSASAGTSRVTRKREDGGPRAEAGSPETSPRSISLGCTRGSTNAACVTSHT